MARPPALDLETPQAGILWRLHKAARENDETVQLQSSLRNNLNIASNVFDLARDALVSYGMCSVNSAVNFGENPVTGNLSENTLDYIYITIDGVRSVEMWPVEKYNQIEMKFGSAVDKFNIILDEDSSSHAGAASESLQYFHIPASDRIVTLDHNQPDYKEVVAALDKVLDEFRKDHRLDNELGHEKGALLKALEGGRELLNDSVVDIRIGTALILEPLRRLVAKYDQAVVGALATVALDLMMKLFGLGS